MSKQYLNFIKVDSPDPAFHVTQNSLSSDSSHVAKFDHRFLYGGLFLKPHRNLGSCNSAICPSLSSTLSYQNRATKTLCNYLREASDALTCYGPMQPVFSDSSCIALTRSPSRLTLYRADIFRRLWTLLKHNPPLPSRSRLERLIFEFPAASFRS
jgi:hypothetical protein